MIKKITLLLTFATIAFTSCNNDDDSNPTPEVIEVVAPDTYSFERNGENTVSFTGQTARIQMSQELVNEMTNFENATVQSLQDMFVNENSPFSTDNLNSSEKNIKSKVAASADYYTTNTAIAADIKAFFEEQLSAQVMEVFPNEMISASPGVAGQISDGASTRYVNGQGFEYNQIVGKGLVGALMLDQIVNNYLSTAVLDATTNTDDNNEEVLVSGKPYTDMEHKWDEAFGYLYGNAFDPANANATTGIDDNFLNKYLGRVEGDTDFTGISQTIFDAFKLGRAAIVANDYDVRDNQVDILREKLSEIIGIRAVYYLHQGKIAMEAGEMGTAFHDLSEGFGFIYSLQFTRNPDTNSPYISRDEVEAFIMQLTSGDGLWEVSPETLDEIANAIASKYEFTVAQAGS